MGAGKSKEQHLYEEVQKGNHDGVKALRRAGASLEFVDKEGRTPLILACMRGELLDMAITLMNLGANINAYKPGNRGGSPLHHAAKKGLEKTVTLLLSRGADPLATNDDGQTPLEVARSKSHVAVVRLLEERLCLFSGMLRELSGPGILEVLTPTWVTKNVWVVVLPNESGPKRAPRYQLAVYQSPKSPQPRTVIQLAKAEVKEPKLTVADPVLHITDWTSKTKYKFLSENQGDKAQLWRLYKSCKGIFQSKVETLPVSLQRLHYPGQLNGNLSPIHPIKLRQSGASSPARQIGSAPFSSISGPSQLGLHAAANIPEDLQLAMALNASIHSAAEGGILVPPAAQPSSRMIDHHQWDGVRNGGYNGGGTDSKKPAKETSYVGRKEEHGNSHNDWGQRPGETSPQISSVLLSKASSNEERLSDELLSAAATHNPPSAPPLPFVPANDEGLFQFIDASPVNTEYSSNQQEKNAASIGKKGDDKVSVPPVPFIPANDEDLFQSIDASPVNIEYSSNQQDKNAASITEKGDDKVSGMCVVCWDAPSQGVCIPCGHLAGCMSCLSEIKEKNWCCPVCRAPIEQVVKVYAV